MDQVVSGWTLRAERVAAGKTQHQLAALMGCSTPNISSIENTKRPRPDTIRKYRDAIKGKAPLAKPVKLAPYMDRAIREIVREEMGAKG